MKVTCWNTSLQVIAENEQDAIWLMDFFDNLDNKDIFSGHIEVYIGEFDSDGKLKVFDEYFNLKDFPKKHDTYIYVETNPKEKTGEEGQVVGIRFNRYNDWTKSYWKKLLKKEIDKQK